MKQSWLFCWGIWLAVFTTFCVLGMLFDVIHVTNYWGMVYVGVWAAIMANSSINNP